MVCWSACTVQHGLLNCFRRFGFYRTQSTTATVVTRMATSGTLDGLRFDNRTLRSLPLDTVEENYPRQVPGACFSRVAPTPVERPKLVCASAAALALLGLKEDLCTPDQLAECFSGNRVLPGFETAAHCYCGHQFGYFSGQLGDGAAMYLGEVLGADDQRWEIQLKGAGLTPYSRTADGRKVLRSSIREFLCSEAMHFLGIPTTRAGCIVTSDTKVMRDQFYDGRAKNERASIVLRIAPTFIRFGSFEIFKDADPQTGRQGPSHGNTALLKQLLDFTISSYFPQISSSLPDEERYLAFYQEVIDMTAKLVAGWQCVGFCHGVLNTDNMSVLGVTIDYGPYGFMDSYDPDHICNSSDEEGRYSYKNQPKMCRWNLEKLAEALAPLLSAEKSMPLLRRYDEQYQQHYWQKMRYKVGLSKDLPGDKFLVEDFLKTMEKTGADFTNAFRSLASCPLPQLDSDGSGNVECLEQLVATSCTARELQEKSRPRMSARKLQGVLQLLQLQPGLFSDREFAGPLKRELDRAQRYETLKSLTDEAKQKEDRDAWTSWLQRYRERLADEATGLSVEAAQEVNSKRIALMNANNPRVILRNYIAQQAIQMAEEGDFSEVKRVLKLLEDPYTVADEVPVPENRLAEENAAACKTQNIHIARYTTKPPEWSATLRVSCSS